MIYPASIRYSRVRAMSGIRRPLSMKLDDVLID